MMISTRGRYALRVMIDLAEQEKDEYIHLKEIADRQNISRKYLEAIMTTLSKQNLVESAIGKEGGYRLNKDPAEYKVGDILRATEGDLSPVACLADEHKKCNLSSECFAMPFWRGLADSINQYIDGYTLKDFTNAMGKDGQKMS